MTGLRRLIGLTVVTDGRAAGHVTKGVLTRDGKRLYGVLVRDGFRAARWLPAERIALIGRVSLIGDGMTRAPRDADFKLFSVTDAAGERIGVVTDALIDPETFNVTALEISSGPIDDLTRGRWLLHDFSVRADGRIGHVCIPSKNGEVMDHEQDDDGGDDRLSDRREVQRLRQEVLLQEAQE